jgi:hypothetical protein
MSKNRQIMSQKGYKMAKMSENEPKLSENEPRILNICYNLFFLQKNDTFPPNLPQPPQYPTNLYKFSTSVFPASFPVDWYHCHPSTATIHPAIAFVTQWLRFTNFFKKSQKNKITTALYKTHHHSINTQPNAMI